MRFKTPEIKDKDQRIITKFAIFPVYANEETRWLEKVTILQQYDSNWADSGWKNIEFIDK